jgi:hypothetical protein
MSKTQQNVLGIVQAPGGVLARIPLERDLDSLWGKQDDRGRPVWIADTIRLAKSRGRPLAYILLRQDKIAPVTLPGEDPQTTTFAQKQALVRRKFRGLESGHIRQKDPVQRMMIVNLVIIGITLVFVLAASASFLPNLLSKLSNMF